MNRCSFIKNIILCVWTWTHSHGEKDICVAGCFCIHCVQGCFCIHCFVLKTQQWSKNLLHCSEIFRTSFFLENLFRFTNPIWLFHVKRSWNSRGTGSITFITFQVCKEKIEWRQFTKNVLIVKRLRKRDGWWIRDLKIMELVMRKGLEKIAVDQNLHVPCPIYSIT